ncbi:aspartate/glutamate racemase family protein [Veronia pacifica]|uniref:Hydantoin racemase n=1 Tax=Veronia pacifica TaxID=1080227 RepID=A0A1C3EBV1_9GAMM|nr:aspartate/glutamate racemase family protein [Veronia pacifica]ODA30670.1 Asp/Glu/hydantoin racemase [Veronia pacifica]
MKLRLINPNTSESMTEKMGLTAQEIAASGTEIISSCPDTGPESIESHFEEAVSVVGILDEIRKGEMDQTDAYILACFGDPGLYAAREVTTAPVIGIAEAAFHLATLISSRFSIVTTLGRTKIIAEHLLHRYGFNEHCRKVRAAEIPVLDLEKDDGGKTCELIISECKRARDEDEVGAIVLGCGGMADLTPVISDEIGIPVIEGVTAAVKLAESLVSLNLATSKHGDWAFPPKKCLKGYLSELSFSREIE